MKSVDVTGLDKAVHRIEKMGESAVHAEVALTEVGEVFLREEAKRYGKGWKPDAASTIAHKAGDEVGVDSGDLKRSLTERGAKWNIFEVLPGEIRFGTSAPHAHLFNRGHKRDGVRVQPARKLIRIYKLAREQAADIILAYITREVP